MTEISNSTLALLVVAALVVVVAGTMINLNSVQRFTGLTGFATTSGNVNLTINTTLAIQVNASASLINFGTCIPRPGVSYTCSSLDAVECSGNAANLTAGNCTGDTTTPQYLEVDNIGNIDANVTVASECTPAAFIGGSSPNVEFQSTQCNGTGVAAWTTLTTSAAAVCSNISYLGGAMRMYVNVTIPANAVGGTGACADKQATVTFTGT